MKVSVIIPMYNESSIIADTAKQLHDAMERDFEDYEILFSDDGSKEFHILTATEADAIISNGDFTERIAAGASCLVPASFGNYTITPADGERVTILRSTAN